MREYTIQHVPVSLPSLTGAIFAPDAEPFCRLPFAAIDHYAWDGDYRPEARAYVGRDNGSLQVLLCAREETLSVQHTAFNDDVWTDSCLEFFLKPFPDDPRYLNIEANASGAALIGIGPDRERRTRLSECPAGMDFRASRHAGEWWAVAYAVPFALIEALFGRSLTPGAAFAGNFYKCDESLHPHFGAWNPIDAPAPDFHRPECFGRLILQA